MKLSASKTFLLQIAAISLFSHAALAQEPAKATASFINSEGEKSGSATLTQTPNGVLIEFELENLPAGGEHGFHIHQTGSCETPGFESAGGHFAPMNRNHGYQDAEGFHAGDMPNQVASADGTIKGFVFNHQITLGEGANSVFDDDGSAIVLHAGADDYSSQPSGDAGSRLLCAKIEEG